MIYFFWLCIIIVVYTYFGYALCLLLIVKIKRLFKQKKTLSLINDPNITLLVAAYNEESCIKQKIENSLSLYYTRSKIEFVIVTDGSTDRTPEIVKEFDEVKLIHQKERQGKIMAIERAIAQVNGEILIFTDANTLLNKNALQNIVKHFSDEKAGVVAGEKRIKHLNKDEAVGAGEGIYWRYESLLKKWDAELTSVMGAAGELFAIRTHLFEPIPKDTLIEDFYLSFKILQKGYRIAYEPQAYALEEPSISIKEELKRKIRIAAGGIQSIVRLSSLFNPFKYGVISFQFISHRVLRWTLAPLALPFIFILNPFLWDQGWIYKLIFSGQLSFYFSAFLGYIFEKRHIRFKLLFIPYYFCMMNYAVYIGFLRYLKNSQSILWEKSVRKGG